NSKVWFNDGLGIFTPDTQTFDTFDVREVAAGDLNGDGHVDLVLARNGVGAVPWSNVVLLGDGTGSFTPHQELPNDDLSVGLALGDIDADGDLDLVVSNVGVSYIYRNDGSGTFGNETTFGGAGVQSYAVRLGDWDRDGDLDLLDARRGSASRVLDNE
ncbi:MAG: VCBS repeat-containing protein, partial [Planctomycetes bacterium]|nr:VCBS repeat-containing protein [Planctomycetota bacterium]